MKMGPGRYRPSAARLWHTPEARRKREGIYQDFGSISCLNLRPYYPDAAPLADALITANPKRILWGSDWPHPDTRSGRKPNDVSSPLRIDDGHLLNLLATWAPDAALRKTILLDNPATLYAL